MSPAGVESIVESVEGVVDVSQARGAAAAPIAPPEVLLEVPHGATRAADFDGLAARLRGPFPEDLRDFFFVNTDVGSPEVAARAASLYVAARPRASVLVIRSRIPRTFVDCNRVLGRDARPTTSAAGGVTPGLPAYVTDPGDVRLLLARHAEYVAVAEAAYGGVCGRGGRAVMVHTYAPRDVDVPVDERIVARLREAYAPSRVDAWPLRAEVDLIADDPDGSRLASPALVEAARAAFSGAGYGVVVNGAYRLHPSTLGHRFASSYPDRVLCLEVRRDLLVPAFTPFAEMIPDATKVERAAAALAEVLLA
jgi:hypothetical protein